MDDQKPIVGRDVNPLPTNVECPTCFAWVGWACEGDDYGYHAAGYHAARHTAAIEAAARKEAP